MSTLPVASWWLLGASICVLLTGLSFLIAFLRGDPSRGRPRCPLCWYSLTGAIPSASDIKSPPKCPECGHVASQSTHLFRTRRPKRRIALGLALMILSPLASYPVWQDPVLLVKRVPDAILLRIAPVDGPSKPGLASALYNELAGRLKAGVYSREQKLMIAFRELSETDRSDDLVVVRPASWRGADSVLAVGYPHTRLVDCFDLQLEARARLTQTASGSCGRWIDPMDSFSGISAGVAPFGQPMTIDVEVSESGKIIWSAMQRKEVRWSESPDEVLAPIPCELATCLRQLPRIELEGPAPSPSTISFVPEIEYSIADANMAFGILVQVLHKGEIQAEGSWVPRMRWHPPTCGNAYEDRDRVDITWRSETPPQICPDDGWTIRVVGTREIAFTDFDHWSFEQRPAPTTYWAGTYEVPMIWEPTTEAGGGQAAARNY